MKKEIGDTNILWLIDRIIARGRGVLADNYDT